MNQHSKTSRRLRALYKENTARLPPDYALLGRRLLGLGLDSARDMKAIDALMCRLQTAAGFGGGL